MLFLFYNYLSQSRPTVLQSLTFAGTVAAVVERRTERNDERGLSCEKKHLAYLG